MKDSTQKLLVLRNLRATGTTRMRSILQARAVKTSTRVHAAKSVPKSNELFDSSLVEKSWLGAIFCRLAEIRPECDPDSATMK